MFAGITGLGMAIRRRHTIKND
ncbi:hypothetical protein [Aliiglaciecola sp. LCG003]